MLGLAHASTPMALSTWSSRVHPDDLDRCYADVKAHLEGKTARYENVHPMRHANGEWLFILDRGRVSGRDEAGKPIRFTGTHFDLTASERAKQAVARHELELAELVANLPTAVALLDTQLRYVTASAQWSAAHGLVGVARRGQLHEALFPKTSPRWKDIFRRALAGEVQHHLVTLTEGYWLFDTPCTQALWKAIVGENPSHFQSPTRPVEGVNWNDVQDFLMQLNGRIPDLDPTLPSEAQWEYACRAGTETAIYTGDLEILGMNNAPALDPIAWYSGNCRVEFDLPKGEYSSSGPEEQYPHTRAGTHQVRLKRANPWGLYDMLGNVSEWCQDGMSDYDENAQTNPVGSLDRGAERVLRGGAWYDFARVVRAASHYADLPRCAAPGSSGPRKRPTGFPCTCPASWRR